MEQGEEMGEGTPEEIGEVHLDQAWLCLPYTTSEHWRTWKSKRVSCSCFSQEKEKEKSEHWPKQ